MITIFRSSEIRQPGSYHIDEVLAGDTHDGKIITTISHNRDNVILHYDDGSTRHISNDSYLYITNPVGGYRSAEVAV